MSSKSLFVKRSAFAAAVLILAAARLRAAEPADAPEPPTLFQQTGTADTSPGEPPPAPKLTRSQNVTVNLINRLVERGVLPREDADDLIHMAEEDAQLARAETAAAQRAANVAQVQAAAAQSAIAEVAAGQNSAPAFSDDDVRVTYVPETVKAQIRDDLRQEVMAQARNENWANPRQFPEWLSHFKFFGDLRIRYEGDYFPEGNDNTGAFPNFNAINTGAPFDVAGTQFSPQLNVDQDRERFRLRLRFGAAMTLDEGFTAGLRIATGENNSPVTTNQSLGYANQGQGGNFSKYAIWLDRAFLKYEISAGENQSTSITIGRFENPFFGTDLVWDDDLGFDGIALQGKYEVAPGLTPFITAGAFPVFNTDLNFASNQPSKFGSYDKYLYGGQLGADWKINKDFSAKASVAFYYFQNIEGRLSDPYTPLTVSDASNTDNSRPSFAQKGNTYFPIRNITPSVLNNFGTINQFQYFGLATPFNDLALTGRVDYSHYDPVHIALVAEMVKNMAFDRNAVDRIAINNRGPNTASGTPGAFEGGDLGWTATLRVGKSALETRGDWNVGFGYRYLETDAVVDGFTDSDFGLGGTNLQGYTIGANVAIASHVSLGLRWLSADSIAGPTYKNDIIQFDINAKF